MAYYLQTDDRELLDKLRREFTCAQCGGRLAPRYDLVRHLPYVQCRDHPEHEGIARLAEEIEYNIEARRNFMVQSHGNQKAVALRRYDAVAVLDKPTAIDILKILFPGCEATKDEFTKALSFCVDYGADPRTNDIYLIPFNTKKRVKDPATGKETQVEIKVHQCVKGINFRRKYAKRYHHYSYLDFSPRVMTKDEEIKIFGSPDDTKFRSITWIKDTDTGEQTYGTGEWDKEVEYLDYSQDRNHPVKKMKANKPKGFEKGNTMLNMSNTRSEGHCLDRAYPADLGKIRAPYVDERFIDAESRIVETPEQKPGDLPGGTGTPPTTIDGQFSEQEDITWDDLEGHQKNDNAEQATATGGKTDGEPLSGEENKKTDLGGELPITDEETKKAYLQLREIINGLIPKALKLTGPDKKPKYTNNKLREEINRVLKVPIVKLEDVKDEDLNKVANRLDFLINNN